MRRLHHQAATAINASRRALNGSSTLQSSLLRYTAAPSIVLSTHRSQHSTIITSAITSSMRCFSSSTGGEQDVEGLRIHIADLRKQFSTAVAEGKDGSALASEVVDGEVTLVDWLTSAPTLETMREALLRGEECWNKFGLGYPHQARLEQSQSQEPKKVESDDLKLKKKRCVDVCGKLKRCAMRLRDTEMAELWDKRGREASGLLQGTAGGEGAGSGLAGLSPGIAAGYRKPVAGMPVQPSTAPNRMRERFGDDDEVDDDGPTQGRADNAGPGGSSQQHQEQRDRSSSSSAPRSGSGASPADPTLDEPINANHRFGREEADEAALSPAERAKRNVMNMMIGQQRGARKQALGQGGSRKGELGGKISDMRHQMMVEDHPMVRSIFRTKEPPGPRWT